MADGEELVRDVWARWNAGLRKYDPEILDPEIEIRSALTAQVFKGQAGVARWVSEIDDQFEEWELSIDEVEETEPDHLVVRGSVKARGRHSGLDLDQPITWNVWLRQGRIRQLINTLGSSG